MVQFNGRVFAYCLKGPGFNPHMKKAFRPGEKEMTLYFPRPRETL